MSTEAGPAPVLSCDVCGGTSEDWRRDLRAIVRYFVRDGLCHPCSRVAGLTVHIPGGLDEVLRKLPSPQPQWWGLYRAQRKVWGRGSSYTAIVTMPVQAWRELLGYLPGVQERARAAGGRNAPVARAAKTAVERIGAELALVHVRADERVSADG